MTVCVKCGVKMRKVQIGIINLELFDDGKPYRLWSADLFQCPKCGVQVLSDFGRERIWEHYESPEPPIEPKIVWG